MRYRTISTNEALNNWSSGITESTGITNESKLAWMSTMLEITSRVINEESDFLNVNEGYGSQGPEASGRMGDVVWPGVGRAVGDTQATGYKRGSGDMANHQLAYAMNVAAYTCGLDIVNVIPMETPSLMFGFMDSIYSANFDQTQEEQGKTDIYIKLSGSNAGYFETGNYSNLKRGDKVFLAQVPEDATKALETIDSTIYGIYLGKDRVSAEPIIKYEGVVKATKAGSTGAARSYTLSQPTDAAPSTVLKKAPATGHLWILAKGVAGASSEEIIDAADAVKVADQYISKKDEVVKGDLVSAVDMFVPEFSQPGAKYDGNDSFAASRKVGELGTQNVISLRLWSTSVEAGTIEVLGELTRTQKRDLAAYGQDGLAHLFKVAQNELTQKMNAHILASAFRLGVTSAAKLKASQGIDLNLFIADPATAPTKALSAFNLTEFKDIEGIDRTSEFPLVKNAESNSSAENIVTRSARIAGRIQAASNIINIVGRHGSADFVVVNHAVASALQNVSGYIVNPFENTIRKNDSSMHTIGTIQGKLTIYVDPNMTWNDTRILVGRKGGETDPGLKMFVYTLGDTTQTISENSMSDKILVSNRYALVPCGFHPEVHYFTFAVNNEYGLV